MKPRNASELQRWALTEMAQLDRSVATLRIFGDDLDPAEISALLGHAATKQQRF